jgi:hypothetical protein
MQILAFSTGCGELAAPAALRSADACNVDNRLLTEIDHSDAPDLQAVGLPIPSSVLKRLRR